MNWYAIIIGMIAISCLVGILLGMVIARGMGSHIDSQRIDE